MAKKTLLNAKDIDIILHRLACQLIENHDDFSNTVLIGLQPRGIFLANRLIQVLRKNYKIKSINIGHLDITFFFWSFMIDFFSEFQFAEFQKMTLRLVSNL